MSDEEAYYQFHRLWTWAVGLPGYDKRAWQSCEAALFDPKRGKRRAALAEPPQAAVTGANSTGSECALCGCESAGEHEQVDALLHAKLAEAEKELRLSESIAATHLETARCWQTEALDKYQPRAEAAESKLAEAEELLGEFCRDVNRYPADDLAGLQGRVRAFLAVKP